MPSKHAEQQVPWKAPSCADDKCVGGIRWKNDGYGSKHATLQCSILVATMWARPVIAKTWFCFCACWNVLKETIHELNKLTCNTAASLVDKFYVGICLVLLIKATLPISPMKACHRMMQQLPNPCPKTRFDETNSGQWKMTLWANVWQHHDSFWSIPTRTTMIVSAIAKTRNNIEIVVYHGVDRTNARRPKPNPTMENHGAR